MRTVYLYIILLLSFISLQRINAQDIQIRAYIDTNTIRIGEQTHLNIDLSYPLSTSVQYKLAEDTLCEHVELVEIKVDTITSDSSHHHFLIHYLITSFDSGYYAIPQQMFVDDIKSDTLWTQALVLAVQGLAIDTTRNSVYNIKEPIEVPWSLKEFLQEYILIILIVILLIVLIVFAIRYFKNKNTQPKIKKIKPKEPAHVIAIRELEVLKEKKLWQNNRVKLYYIGLTDIIRQYIEYRFEITALEQTSDEIIADIKNNKEVGVEEQERLEKILKLADMVKFAKWQPLSDENDMVMKEAFRFVENTKPIDKNKEKGGNDV